MLLDQEAAADAVQDAALKAWTKLPNLREGAEITPWWLAIVANQCRTTKRGSWWSVLKGFEITGTSGLSEDRLVQGMDLMRAVKRLKRRDRTILILHYYFDMSLEQVAAIMDLSGPATKSRLYRAIRQLRPHLEIAEVRP